MRNCHWKIMWGEDERQQPLLVLLCFGPWMEHIFFSFVSALFFLPILCVLFALRSPILSFFFIYLFSFIYFYFIFLFLPYLSFVCIQTTRVQFNYTGIRTTLSLNPRNRIVRAWCNCIVCFSKAVWSPIGWLVHLGCVIWKNAMHCIMYNCTACAGYLTYMWFLRLSEGRHVVASK